MYCLYVCSIIAVYRVQYVIMLSVKQRDNEIDVVYFVKTKEKKKCSNR